MIQTWKDESRRFINPFTIFHWVSVVQKSQKNQTGGKSDMVHGLKGHPRSSGVAQNPRRCRKMVTTFSAWQAFDWSAWHCKCDTWTHASSVDILGLPLCRSSSPSNSSVISVYPSCLAHPAPGESNGSATPLAPCTGRHFSESRFAPSPP